MMIWNLKIKEIKSFIPDGDNLEYEIVNVHDQYSEIAELFKNDIQILENPESNCILCFRGDSKNSLELHKVFF